MQTWEDDKSDAPADTIEKLCGELSGDLGSEHYHFGMHIAELSVLHSIDDVTFMENMRKAAVESPKHYLEYGCTMEDVLREIVNNTAVAVTRRRMLLVRAPEKGNA